ncbi:MAG: hypothetical protein WCT04_10195 [Planctomycetota bacterium]
MSTEIPSTRLTRTAWIVMILGLVTSAAMIGGVTVFAGNQALSGTQDLLPVLGMAVAIGMAGLCWGVVLAIRAIRQGEPARGPLVLISVATLVPAIFCGAYWFIIPDDRNHILLRSDWIIASAAPVFAPFFSFVVISGILLLRPLLRWIERRRTRAGKTDWSRRERLKFGALMGLGYAFVLGCVVLPVPLSMHFFLFAERAVVWGFVPKNSPQWVSDAAESGLPTKFWTGARLNAIRYGNLSLNRMKERYENGGANVRSRALTAATYKYPEWALSKAFEILANPTYQPLNSEVLIAQQALTKCGSDQQRRDYLREAIKTNSPTAYWFFIVLPSTRRDPDLIPLLKSALMSSMPHREQALIPLSAWLSPDDMDALLKEALYGNKDLRILVITKLLNNGPSAELRAQLFLAFLDDPDMTTRMKAMSNYYDPDIPPELKKEAITRLARMFSSANSVDRRGAALQCCRLLKLTRNPDYFIGILGMNVSTIPGSSVIDGAPPAVETEAETKAINVIRDKAEEWLKENVK